VSVADDEQGLLWRVALSDETLVRDENSSDLDARRRIADALVQKADALVELKRPEDALVCSELALARFDADPETVSVEQAAWVMRTRVVSLRRLERLAECVDASDQLIQRFGGEQPPEVRRHVAAAGLVKVSALIKAGEPVDAEAAADWVIGEFSSDPLQGPKRVDSVGSALLLKGVAIRDQGRPVVAIEAFDDLVRRLDVSPASNARLLAARGLNEKAKILRSEERFDEAAEVSDAVVTRFGDEEDPGLSGQVSVALAGGAESLRRSGHLTEAVLLYDRLIPRLDRQARTGDQTSTMAILYLKAMGLQQLGRLDAAIETCDEILARSKGDDRPKTQQRVVSTLWDQSRWLNEAGRADEQHEVLQTLISTFRDVPEPKVRQIVATAMFNDAVLLRDRGEVSDAIALWDELEDHFGTDPALRLVVIKGQIGKFESLLTKRQSIDEVLAGSETLLAESEQINALGTPAVIAGLLGVRRDYFRLAKQADRVLATNQEIIDRFGDAAEPDLRVTVNYAIGIQIRWLLRSGRVDAAISESERLLNRFDQTPDLDLAARLLKCAHDLTSSPGRSKRDAIILRGAVIATATVEQATSAVVPRRLWPPAPHTQLTQVLAGQQRASAQALKITRHLSDHYRDDPDGWVPAAARFATGTALWGVGRPIQAFRTGLSAVSARHLRAPAFQLPGEGPGNDGPNFSGKSAPLGFLRTKAIEGLGDHDRTIASYDAFINTFSTNTSPFTKWLVKVTQDERRKALTKQS
jgi:tetratricopeptide (TPR) repeat protein